MPLISKGDGQGIKGRLLILSIYASLIVGGLTMVYPFMVTLTGSISSAYDYERRSPIPHYLLSQEERLMRVLCFYFPAEQYDSLKHMRSYFPSFPEEWLTWAHAGDDQNKAGEWAATQLAKLQDDKQKQHIVTMAADYSTFMESWNLEESFLAYDPRHVAPFLREQYPSLEAFNKAWEIAVDDFTQVVPYRWRNVQFHQQSYIPFRDVRYNDLLAFRRAYQQHRFTEFLADDTVAASLLRPSALAFDWERFAAKPLGISDYEKLHELPFPVPADAPEALLEVWYSYLLESFPIRHIRIEVSGERQVAYTAFLKERFRNISYLNDVLRTGDINWQNVSDWDGVILSESVPVGTLGKVWIDFVKTHVPVETWQISSTLPEKAFQSYALDTHGGLEGVNAAYGLELKQVENLRIPLQAAVLNTFDNHEGGFTWYLTTRNYGMVMDYLFLRGRAAINTVILIVLTIILTLTVNPLAGYALSRFQLPQTEKILLFCLATMAFPAAVAAIPGFLLMRDLGLLNTFAALVLPGAANGMSIFMLKGFFDSLPQELYEAATIDGAPEWQIFMRISLPLVKPILAVNVLGSFIAAYSGWSWAIIVCQDQSMWTIAVWTYQFSQTFANQPFSVMAAYIVNSLPVFIVFILCQNVIMRGIILPTMK